jgi:hypothetical protein
MSHDICTYSIIGICPSPVDGYYMAKDVLNLPQVMRTHVIFGTNSTLH